MHIEKNIKAILKNILVEFLWQLFELSTTVSFSSIIIKHKQWKCIYMSNLIKNLTIFQLQQKSFNVIFLLLFVTRTFHINFNSIYIIHGIFEEFSIEGNFNGYFSSRFHCFNYWFYWMNFLRWENFYEMLQFFPPCVNSWRVLFIVEKLFLSA